MVANQQRLWLQSLLSVVGYNEEKWAIQGDTQCSNGDSAGFLGSQSVALWIFVA